MTKTYQSIVQKGFYPKTLLLVVLFLISATALAAVFIWKYEHTVFACLVYALCVYTLAAIVLRSMKTYKRGKLMLYKIPVFHRYCTEIDFRAKVSLCFSFAVNVLYCLWKAFTAIYYRSFWFGALAFYYMVLSTMRFLLLCYIRRKNQNFVGELKRFRLCGYFILILTIAIAAVGIHTIKEGKAFEYPGTLIYAAAFYTFYNLILAIANMARYRKIKSPVNTASRAITLATALVSLFFLQTALLATFGNDFSWQQQMNGLTGFGVCALVSIMAMWMIITGRRTSAR